MPRKKMSLQALWIGAVLRSGLQLSADAQGVVARVADAEHPLVASRGTHTVADLIGQGLEGELVIARAERATDGVTGTVLGLRLQEQLDRFFEPSRE
jgi:hypothetical protein